MANTAAKGYVALRNFDLNGEQKTAGSVIRDLSAADAEAFLAVGIIVEVPAEPVTDPDILGVIDGASDRAALEPYDDGSSFE